MNQDQIRAALNRERIIKSRGNRCARCGQVHPSACFEFHHLVRTPDSKGVFSYRALSSMFKEASKCIMVCANCHKLMHSLPDGSTDLFTADNDKEYIYDETTKNSTD